MWDLSEPESEPIKSVGLFVQGPLRPEFGITCSARRFKGLSCVMKSLQILGDSGASLGPLGILGHPPA